MRTTLGGAAHAPASSGCLRRIRLAIWLGMWTLLAGCAVPAGASDGAATLADCRLPPLPTPPSDAVDVRRFGALPDDEIDDTAAIQAALDSLAPGQWLRFPPGRYLHRARLNVRTPGVVLWGAGATLHATHADDQAVMLSADGASLYRFTLTAVTGERRHAPWQARIALFDRVDRIQPLRGNVVRGNRVLPAGAPGTPLANSASSAGIFVYRADRFLVADNEIRRSLSDGIHLTAGARNGRVLFNRVHETGDDMIGMVSYLASGDWQADSADRMAVGLEGRRELQLVRNVLVAHNDVEGQYWGRGISVVGGADITIRHNRITRAATGAGVLLAREANYVTWGVHNVRVEDNQLGQVQTLAPAYMPAGWARAGERTGHAAIEIHAFVFDDERRHPELLQALAVQDLRIAGNTVSDTGGAGIRVGAGGLVPGALLGRRPDGEPLRRAYSGGPLSGIDLSSNRMSRTAGAALAVETDPSSAGLMHCEDLTGDGRAIVHPACGGRRPDVSGASIGCGS